METPEPQPVEVLDGFRFLMPYYQYLDTLAGDMEPNR